MGKKSKSKRATSAQTQHVPTAQVPETPVAATTEIAAATVLSTAVKGAKRVHAPSEPVEASSAPTDKKAKKKKQKQKQKGAPAGATTAPVAASQASPLSLATNDKKGATEKNQHKAALDDIFASRPKKNPESAEDTTESAAASTTQKRVPQRVMAVNDEDGFSDTRGVRKKNRKLIDGLRVYTYQELGINADSGGTPDCPFDCDCCF
eukprot:m.6912 g.6912  ORF g.6912 m.6912 type:complete len:207 (+) comp5204_c0_seq1:167-787(+)